MMQIRGSVPFRWVPVEIGVELLPDLADAEPPDKPT